MSDERWKEKYYDKIAELNIAESRASQFESTLTETMKERDELKDWGLVRQKAFAEQAEVVEKVIKERDISEIHNNAMAFEIQKLRETMRAALAESSWPLVKKILSDALRSI